MPFLILPSLPTPSFLTNAHTFATIGGFGKYLAHWMIHGEPPHELIDTDPGRFGKWTTKDYVHEKVRETYGFNNILVFPKEERPHGRKMRINPIYEVHSIILYL